MLYLCLSLVLGAVSGAVFWEFISQVRQRQLEEENWRLAIDLLAERLVSNHYRVTISEIRNLSCFN